MDPLLVALEAVRRSKNLSQAALAREMQIKPSHWCRVRSKELRPGTEFFGAVGVTYPQLGGVAWEAVMSFAPARQMTVEV